MRLTELWDEAPDKMTGWGDVEIRGLTADSRTVEPGFLFAALPGSRADGRAFIGEAVRRGAAAVLAPRGSAVPAGVALLADDNPRQRLARMAARFYGPQPRLLAAVTGTNGKTSVAAFARQIWTLCGHRAGSLGTLGVVAPGHDAPGALTTPDPVALHRTLAALAADGIDHVALEASSHGLAQYRLDGLRLGVAGFTNLTRDHLDYHGTEAAYRAAKLRLFEALLPPGGTAVLNADAAHYAAFAEVAQRRGHRLLRYGRAGVELRLLARTPEAGGQRLRLELLGRPYDVRLPLAGAFQAENALCALGLVVGGGGEEPEKAVAALERLAGVRGRLERVAAHGGAEIYVDYAHTPDALETVLRALRPHAAGRLVVVFGCGGDRDPGKRPLMGAIAARLADRAIVTDDNPRGEDPAAIRAAILAACPGALEIGDRAAAIRAAVAALRPGDLLVIAGKGHETGQTVAGVTHPFDDAVVARAAVASLSGAGGRR